MTKRIRLLGLVLVVLGCGSGGRAEGLLQVDFSAEISSVTGVPFGKAKAEWEGLHVTGSFLYDSGAYDLVASKDLTGTGTRTNEYRQDLEYSGFVLYLPGHQVLGSSRPLIRVIHSPDGRRSNEFQFRDGVAAVSPEEVEKYGGSRQGALFADDEEDRMGSVRLDIGENQGLLAGPELPDPFPFEHVGGGVAARLEVKVSGGSFQLDPQAFQVSRP